MAKQAAPDQVLPGKDFNILHHFTALREGCRPDSKTIEAASLLADST